MENARKGLPKIRDEDKESKVLRNLHQRYRNRT